MKKNVPDNAALISVMVTVYNMEACLDACVSSILTQSHTHFELLLIDDGSTDRSGLMCDAYARQDARVRVVHQENQGLSGARNTAVRHARGEYLSFVDADDVVLPDYLKILLDLCQAHQVPLAACNHTLVRGDKRAPRFCPKGPAVVMDAREALEHVMYQEAPDVSCWGKLYHRSLLTEDLYPTGKLYEDTYAFGDIMLRAKSMAFTPVPLYDYILRNDSLSHGAYSDVRYQYMEAVEHLTEKAEAAYPDLEESCLCRRAFSMLSVRRYFVDCAPHLKPKRRALEKQIRKHACRLLKNPRVPKRDKVGTLALLLGPGAYDMLWKGYEKIRRGKQIG